MLSEGATDAEKVIAAHRRAYSQDLLAQRIVIFAGRTLVTTEGSFASAVIRTRSEDDARVVMEGYPAIQGGRFSDRLFPCQPMLIGERPSGP